MASQQQIIDILNRLGNNQQNSIALTSLAREIKQKQTSTKIAIEACINLISRLANRGNQMEDVLRAANDAGLRENSYINELTEILRGSPTQQEINDVIQQLRTTVNEQIQRDANFGDGVMDAQQREVLGLTQNPAGGFNWRSQSNKPKKSSRITRRRSKSKIKSRRTTRNKGKKSVRKSKSKSN